MYLDILSLSAEPLFAVSTVLLVQRRLGVRHIMWHIASLTYLIIAAVDFFNLLQPHHPVVIQCWNAAWPHTVNECRYSDQNAITCTSNLLCLHSFLWTCVLVVCCLDKVKVLNAAWSHDLHVQPPSAWIHSFVDLRIVLVLWALSSHFSTSSRVRVVCVV